MVGGIAFMNRSPVAESRTSAPANEIRQAQFENASHSENRISERENGSGPPQIAYLGLPSARSRQNAGLTSNRDCSIAESFTCSVGRRSTKQQTGITCWWMELFWRIRN